MLGCPCHPPPQQQKQSSGLWRSPGCAPEPARLNHGAALPSLLSWVLQEPFPVPRMSFPPCSTGCVGLQCPEKMLPAWRAV